MKRTLLVALIAIPCLLAASDVWRDAHHGVGHVLGTIGWLGFLVALLTVLVVSIALAFRTFRARWA